MQQVPLLQTSCTFPPSGPLWFSRPRLVERLNAGLYRNSPLSPLRPASGKTTLVSEWVAGFDQLEPQVRVAWLSLDAGDN